MIPCVLSLLLTAGPCDPVDRSAADPDLAATYAKVAAEEEARGALEASAAAWRIAAQLEPAGGAADQALQRLCALADSAAAFEQARDLFERHDCPTALPLLRKARRGAEGASAALLEGICASELGDDAGALESLYVASADPELASTAELFLGLLALRQGDNRAALTRLRGAARSENEPLRSTAADLLRLADRKERLVVEAAVEGGYDSNPAVSAFPTVLPGGTDDGFAAVSASVAFKPLAEYGPFLLVGGGYRKQVLFRAADVGLASGTLGWELRLARLRASLDYGLDFVSLGPAPWLLRQRGTLRGLLTLGRAALTAEYVLRHETFWKESAQLDTGLRHAGRLGASVQLGLHLLELSALATRASASTRWRSSSEAAGELRWVVRPLPSLDVEAAFGAQYRAFDAIDPELPALRRDVQLEGRVGVDWMLTRSLALFFAVDGRRVESSVAELTHSRLGASAGLRASVGVW